MIILDFSIKDPKRPPTFRFPECCVNYERPKSKEYKLSLRTGAQKRRQMVQDDVIAREFNQINLQEQS
jgi:hypothetical protein